MEFLYSIIRRMFPSLKDEDFSLKDDGEGAYILEWNSEHEKPTISDLEAYWAEHKDEILAELEPEPEKVDILEQTQSDLIFTLMMNGVI
jgi:hypothetical protein